jgi:hypothetical protein
MKRFLFVGLALVGVLAVTPGANATPLAAGGTTTVISSSDLTGLTLVDQWSVAFDTALNPPFGVPQTIFGTYQEWVYKDDSGNLTFLEQVSLNPGSAEVHRITVSAYGTFTTDVSVLTDLPPTGLAGGVSPNNGVGGVIAARSFDGNVVGFGFVTTAITGGTHSSVLAITTDAKNYNKFGVLSVIDGTTSSNLTFQPTAVPEPSTLAIAGLGGLGLIGFGLRRRKAMGV